MTRKGYERFAHPEFPRVTVLRRGHSKFYHAQTFLGGRLRQHSLKTTDDALALRLAKDWYRRELRSFAATKREHPDATPPVLGELFIDYRNTLGEKQQKEALMRWGPIQDFWRTRALDEVVSETFTEFYRWRKGVKAHTVHKDICLLRQMLKYAEMQTAWDFRLPRIPKFGRIEQNPRPWFTQQEWARLQRASDDRINAAPNVRVKQQRQDLDDQMEWMIATMMRVDEMLSVRVRDCRLDKNVQGDRIILCDVVGKRGQRTVVGRWEAKRVYVRRKKMLSDPDALLFPEHHKDAFTELLKKTGLHEDSRSGFTRNFKSLRCTAISFAVLRGVDLMWIARNAGTSVQMIDQFYARRLSAEMAKDQLTAQD